MAGRVKNEAEYYKLPYEVLIGADSEVFRDYEIIKLPRIVIVGKDRKIHTTEKYLSYEKLKKEVDRALK
jgi:predicted RNase H-related nuclease YkuK (DUF458 family)